MEVYFPIGSTKVGPSEIYNKFIKDKIIAVLADQNPFWSLNYNLAKKIIAYWPEKDPLFKFYTPRVLEIKYKWKNTTLNNLLKDLKREDRLYLPLKDWGEADIHIFLEISNALEDDCIRILFIERGSWGTLTEIGALKYLKNKKKVIFYTTESGEKWLKELFELCNVEKMPNIVLI